MSLLACIFEPNCGSYTKHKSPRGIATHPPRARTHTLVKKKENHVKILISQMSQMSKVIGRLLRNNLSYVNGCNKSRRML